MNCVYLEKLSITEWSLNKNYLLSELKDAIRKLESDKKIISFDILDARVCVHRPNKELSICEN